MGYNYIWELFVDKTIQNVTKAVIGVGSSLVLLDVYETAAHAWDNQKKMEVHLVKVKEAESTNGLLRHDEQHLRVPTPVFVEPPRRNIKRD